MVDLAGELLILTGPPGSGKSTTAAALARLPGSSKVHLHTDDYWGYIRHGHIDPWLPEAHGQNEIVVDVMARAAEGYCRGNYLVVLDGIVGPWFLSRFRSLSVPVHYIVLRPDVDEAIARCIARGGDTLCDPAPIAGLHRQFGRLGELEKHVIHTGGLDLAQQLATVVDALSSGAFRLSQPEDASDMAVPN